MDVAVLPHQRLKSKFLKLFLQPPKKNEKKTTLFLYFSSLCCNRLTMTSSPLWSSGMVPSKYHSNHNRPYIQFGHRNMPTKIIYIRYIWRKKISRVPIWYTFHFIIFNILKKKFCEFWKELVHLALLPNSNRVLNFWDNECIALEKPFAFMNN